MKLYVLLPAYNEEQALPPLAQKIDDTAKEHGIDYCIVVVNDGSSDDTARVAEELGKQYPIDLVSHKYNRGLGETIRDGFEYICELAAPDDIIVRMDCDDTHHPKYIPTMIEKINQGYEVVITSRYAPGGGQIGVNWYRRAMSRAANSLMKMIFPIPGVWEYSCGYRAYRASAIQDAIAIFGNRFIDLKGMGFTGTVEKIIKFKMMGVRITEIPFVLRYDQKIGVSKVVSSITTLGYLALILKNIVYWGDIGKTWQEKIAERKARVYGPDGKLIDKQGGA